MVEQEVIVHVQLVEHPAQGVLADGQDAGVKPCGGKARHCHGLDVLPREEPTTHPDPLLPEAAPPGGGLSDTLLEYGGGRGRGGLK